MAAAQRAIERDLPGEFDIAAAAHLAGPYSLSGSMRLTNAIAGYQFFVPFMVTAWQKVYGNLYGEVTQAFRPPYASSIESLLPSPTLTYATLVATGALPGGPGVSPDQARDLLFQPAFLADMQANPDSATVLAARRNDPLGWSPRSRTLLCGGTGDPTVPGALHVGVAQADFASRGLANVTSVDVEPPLCHAQARALFNTVR